MRYDFPFNIREIAGILNLRVRHDKGHGKNMDVDCPFCNKQGKLNLNASKNAFRCNYCIASGGMLALYGRVMGLPNNEARIEICRILGYDDGSSGSGDSGRNGSKRAELESKSNRASGNIKVTGASGFSAYSSTPYEPPKRADDYTIHNTYSALLSMLPLAEYHEESLLARGLSLDDIERHGYKSVPTSNHQKICEMLMQAGYTVEHVPGFHKDVDSKGEWRGSWVDGVWHGRWNVKLTAPGIIIPIRGIDGKIAALQIRLDRVFKGRKYIWLSSTDMDGGASSGAPIHFVGNPSAKQVFITEGGLKGNVAHSLSGHAFACIAGANNHNRVDELLQQFKSNGVEGIIEALDMDKVVILAEDNENLPKNMRGARIKDIRSLVDPANIHSDTIQKGNVHIAIAVQNLWSKIVAHGFRIKSAEWNDENGAINGIDDHFFAKLQKERINACGTVVTSIAV